MKTVAKVFSILSIIGGAIILLFGLIGVFGAGSITSAIPDPENPALAETALKIGSGIYAFAGVIVIVIQIWLTIKLNRAISKNELIVPGVISLIFGGFLAGLFTLLIPENEFSND